MDDDMARGGPSGDTAPLLAALCEKIGRYLDGQRERDTPLRGLSFAMLLAPTPPVAYLYPPSLSLIVSGRKRVRLGSEDYVYDSSRFLLTSVNLPTVTEVVEATPRSPYISLRMGLDLPFIRDFITKAQCRTPARGHGQALATGAADARLLAALDRLIDIIEDEHALQHLGPLIQQEIVYYILTGAAGARLRDIAIPDSGSYRAAKAISWIQENYAGPLRIEELASRVGLGVSTLHKHFRDMTAMSPLAYQKQLRLLEARRLLVTARMEAVDVAVHVGYESTSQFNREYKRMFGDPPIRSAVALRTRTPAQGDPPA